MYPRYIHLYRLDKNHLDQLQDRTIEDQLEHYWYMMLLIELHLRT